MTTHPPFVPHPLRYFALRAGDGAAMRELHREGLGCMLERRRHGAVAGAAAST